MTTETKTNVQDQLAAQRTQGKTQDIFGGAIGYVNTKGYDPLNNWQRTSPWDTQTRTLPYITTSTSTGEVKKEEKEVSIDIENVEVTQTFMDELIKIVTTKNVDLYLKGVTIKEEVKEKIALSDQNNEIFITDTVKDPLPEVIEEEQVTANKLPDGILMGGDLPEPKGAESGDPLVPTDTANFLEINALQESLYRSKRRELTLEQRIRELDAIITKHKAYHEDPLDYNMEMDLDPKGLTEHDLKTK